jgi:exodeoxyribonuclease VII large subunit
MLLALSAGERLSKMKPVVLTVSDVNQYVKKSLEGNDFLASIAVKGEISSFKHHSSGHMYFTLKDEKATLRCVMFRNQNQFLGFSPATGMEILAFGAIRVFARDGIYQLYVEAMEPAGLGSLHLAFAQLNAKLEEEGLFAKECKLPLPVLPRKVGVITSVTGAAIQDIINVARRRFSAVDLVIAPVFVQGDKAVTQLKQALKNLSSIPEIEVIIIARGGGAWEELQPFNDETLAREIRACPIPVVTAIGHETDFTIADFAADLRAPTPSAAAELVVPDVEALKRRLDILADRCLKSINRKMGFYHSTLEKLYKRRPLASPYLYFNEKRQMLDVSCKHLERAMDSYMEERRNSLSFQSGRLDTLNPLAVLKRGYSLVYDENGHVVRTPLWLEIGSKIRVVMAAGQIWCQVEELEVGDGVEQAKL